MKKKEPVIFNDAASLTTELTIWPHDEDSKYYGYVQLRVHHADCHHGESILLTTKDAHRLGRMLLKTKKQRKE